jgi:hypothetical protein
MKISKRAICVLLAVLFALSAFGCSFNFSTATVEDAYMTDTVDSGVPGAAVASFPADVEIVYAAATLRNAPDNTQVLVVWSYVTGGDQQIDQVLIDSGDIADRYIYSSYQPTALLSFSSPTARNPTPWPRSASLLCRLILKTCT